MICRRGRVFRFHGESIDSIHPGVYQSRIVLQTSGEILETSVEFEILNPPDVHTVSIEPPTDPVVAGEGRLAPLIVWVQNAGDVRSDPLILAGDDTLLGATFEEMVPPLEPGEKKGVQVKVDSPSSRFIWITTYKQEPDVIRRRTRSRPEKFSVEVPRAKELSISGENSNSIRWQAETF